jgi:hypothetical protein
MTSKHKITFLAVIFFIFSAATAIAGDFDGSKPLSGITGKIIEINQYKIIDDVDPDTVGLPKKNPDRLQFQNPSSLERQPGKKDHYI